MFARVTLNHCKGETIELKKAANIERIRRVKFREDEIFQAEMSATLGLMEICARLSLIVLVLVSATVLGCAKKPTAEECKAAIRHMLEVQVDEVQAQAQEAGAGAHVGPKARPRRRDEALARGPATAGGIPAGAAGATAAAVTQQTACIPLRWGSARKAGRPEPKGKRR